MALITTTILSKFLKLIHNPGMELSLLAVTNIGMCKIIAKAGYSRRWFWIPLLPTALFAVLYVWKRWFLSTPPRVPSTLFQLVEFAYVFTFVLAWLLTMVFASSRWPVSVGLRQISRVESLRTGVLFSGGRLVGDDDASANAVRPSSPWAPATTPTRSTQETVPSSTYVNPADRIATQQAAPERTVSCERCGAAIAQGSEYFHECQEV